jgi:ribosome maturation factor RimP
MSRNEIENLVEQMATPILQELGYEIVEVEYILQENGMNLTIFIYKEGGITIEDCKIVNSAIYGPLDELNPTNDEAYVLNVSSPGLDRPLKSIRDFERNLEKEFQISYILPEADEKTISGKLTNIENNILTINQKGKFVKVEFGTIARALLVIKF